MISYKTIKRRAGEGFGKRLAKAVDKAYTTWRNGARGSLRGRDSQVLSLIHTTAHATLPTPCKRLTRRGGDGRKAGARHEIIACFSPLSVIILVTLHLVLVSIDTDAITEQCRLGKVTR